MRPPEYGIAAADHPRAMNPTWYGLSTATTRISDPREGHEREADRLAQRFLATRSPASLDQTPAAFGRFTAHDLSSVRVHHDERSDASARALGTGAFTIGDHVGLARGRASVPLLAHELAHVVGQRERPELRDTIWREPPTDEDERRKQLATAGKTPPATTPPATNPPATNPPATDTTKTDPPFVHPYAPFGLVGDLFNRTMTKRYPELRLNGSEWYGAWALGGALLNPLWQVPPVQGGGATPGQWTQDYTRFTKYVSGLQKLTPGKGDPYIDALSLMTGTRVEDWLGHDRFLKQALPKYWWQLLLHLAAVQGGYSAYQATKDPGTPGTLATNPTFSHFGILQGLGGAALKKYMTLGNHPLGVGIPIGSDIGLPMTGPLSTGIPGSGLTLDYQTGVGVPGEKLDFGMPFNLGEVIRSATDKPKSPLELGLWGSYNRLRPTPAMLTTGSEPSETWSVGAHGGYDYHLGGQYRYRQSGGMTMHQGDLGLGYQPRDPKHALTAGPVSFPRFGANFGYANWTGAGSSVYGPRLGSDAADAVRFSPYLDLGFNLGKGYQLSVGGQPSATFRGGTSPERYLDGLRLMIALQHMPAGSAEADKKRLELSYSQNRYEWMDPNSPMMHALKLKGQWGPWFAGAQVNWMNPGLASLAGGPYARDFATSTDPLRDISILALFGYRFGTPNYDWGFKPR
ncbi:DUF4157 domain-containing protein [Nannocystaceae bacterium ST9]